MKINSLLSDEEIANCIEGSFNIKMIREVIDISQLDNLLDVEDFADLFAFLLKEFISVTFEEDEDEYDECYMNNWEWGQTIAEKINQLLVDKWTKL